MEIQTVAQTMIHADIERVFDASTDCQNLPKFFTGYKGIPGIVSARTGDGLPLQEGSTRIVENQDGSRIEEVIVALERPHTQAYELVNGLKPPVSWLVRTARGRWAYEAIAPGTQITWTFTFVVPNRLAAIVFQRLVKPRFQQAQGVCLENIKRYVESDGVSPPGNL